MSLMQIISKNWTDYIYFLGSVSKQLRLNYEKTKTAKDSTEKKENLNLNQDQTLLKS